MRAKIDELLENVGLGIEFRIDYRCDFLDSMFKSIRYVCETDSIENKISNLNVRFETEVKSNNIIFYKLGESPIDLEQIKKRNNLRIEIKTKVLNDYLFSMLKMVSNIETIHSISNQKEILNKESIDEILNKNMKDLAESQEFLNLHVSEMEQIVKDILES